MFPLTGLGAYAPAATTGILVKDELGGTAELPEYCEWDV